MILIVVRLALYTLAGMIVALLLARVGARVLHALAGGCDGCR